ncbi:MFS general substrate transporter [Amylostereum chailletii]|nr:MFS general substrate transporter [Amylostereum chailletii]
MTSSVENVNSAKELASDASPSLDLGEVPVVADGGPRAWCTLVGGWFTLLTTFGYTTAFGVYQDIYTREHAASASRISWIGSTQLFLILALALPAGKLLDMGYFRQTTFFGSFIYVFSLFMLSLAHPDKYYQIYLSQGLGMGIGAGILYVPAVAIQAHHWKRRRALAMGIVATGSSIGGIFLPIMLNQLFAGSTGFAWGVRASAFLVLGLLIIANLLMSDRRDISKSSLPKPNIKALFTDVPYMVSIFACVLSPHFYLQLFAILHGVDPTVAFYMLALMNGLGIPGRIIPNAFVPLLGVYNLLIVSGFVCSALIFALYGISSTAGVVIFAILYGFFSGAFLSLCTPAVASLSRHEGEIGTRVGLAFFLTSVGTLTGNPIDGALLGDTFPWGRALVFSGVCRISPVSLWA